MRIILAFVYFTQILYFVKRFLLKISKNSQFYANFGENKIKSKNQHLSTFAKATVDKYVDNLAKMTIFDNFRSGI